MWCSNLTHYIFSVLEPYLQHTQSSISYWRIQCKMLFSNSQIWNVEVLMLFTCQWLNAGDQLAIAKETGRRLGMGTNMYPSSSLLGREKEEHEALPIDELVEMADGFAGVYPGILIWYLRKLVVSLRSYISFSCFISFPFCQ